MLPAQNHVATNHVEQEDSVDDDCEHILGSETVGQDEVVCARDDHQLKDEVDDVERAAVDRVLQELAPLDFPCGDILELKVNLIRNLIDFKICRGIRYNIIISNLR